MSNQEPLQDSDERRRQAEARKQARRMRANDADPDRSAPEEETEISDDEGPG